LSLEGEGSLSDVGVVKVGPTGELKPAGPSEESRNALQLFNALSKKEQKNELDKVSKIFLSENSLNL